MLEEIVGEIYDRDHRDIMGVSTTPDGHLILPGSFPIHDLTDVGVELTDAPRGDYTTIAGLVLVSLGRIPASSGDHVELADWTIEGKRRRPECDHRSPPDSAQRLRGSTNG